MRRLALTFFLALAGCATHPTLPKVVHVPVETVVAVPAELTRDCREVPKRDESYGEAVRLANARKDALDECTDRMRKIRELKR